MHGFHQRPIHFSSVYGYLGHVKGLYAALGIEIVCITAAEIGENTGLYLFGLNPLVIAIAYGDMLLRVLKLFTEEASSGILLYLC